MEWGIISRILYLRHLDWMDARKGGTGWAGSNQCVFFSFVFHTFLILAYFSSSSVSLFPHCSIALGRTRFTGDYFLPPVLFNDSVPRQKATSEWPSLGVQQELRIVQSAAPFQVKYDSQTRLRVFCREA
ncbi:hypothetical protein CPC08DRAFT_108768 [Agrocybe pediades]|nr:hypothetical protein CPC08DRAFT_108768 [Agrocybe pediades]